MLGKVGFGTVYAGFRTRDGIHVAIIIKHVAKSKVVEWELVSLASFFCSHFPIFFLFPHYYFLNEDSTGLPAS